jgi:uncharacterized membrane protein
MIYVGALILGIVSGMRSLTSPAVVLLARGNTVAGAIVGLLALGEFVGDLLPKTPARTSPAPLGFRIISGAFVGWTFFAMHGRPSMTGAIFGVVGALIGTYVGYTVRVNAIESIGAVPSALLEDLIAIGLATFAVLKIF